MAYLEITLKIEEHNRAKAGEVYCRFKQPFLKNVAGAKSKELLVPGENVQVLHGFDTVANGVAYTRSQLLQDDVVVALQSPLSVLAWLGRIPCSRRINIDRSAFG